MKSGVLSLCVVFALALSAADANSAIVSVGVGVGAMAGDETAIDIDADGTADFTFRGNALFCTADVPTSACIQSVTIQGREGIEFLYGSPSGGPARPLVAGDVLGAGSAGVWAAAPFHSLGISWRMDMRNPANSGYGEPLDGRDVYAIGFRLHDAAAGYRYGWIDVALTGGQFAGPGNPEVTAVRYSDTAGADVVYSPIPEPTPVLLAAASAAFAFRRRRRPATGCVADFRDRRRGSA